MTEAPDVELWVIGLLAGLLYLCCPWGCILAAGSVSQGHFVLYYPLVKFFFFLKCG